MNINSDRLPLRPLPKPGASLAFYLVKLAIKNGQKSVRALLKGTGLINHKYYSPDSVRLIEHVSKITGHDEGTLFSSSFPEKEMGIEITNHVYPYRQFVLNTPHFCPACLDKHKSLRAQWQYLPNTYCHEHNQRLLSHCPNCNHQFEWDAELLSYGCCYCVTPWSAMITLENKRPEYLRHFNNITDPTDKLNYLNDLLLAAKRSIRPYDSILEEPRERLPEYISDWHTVLVRAYEMLTNEAFYYSWLKSCLVARQDIIKLGRNALIHPVLTLKKQLTLTWPLHNFTPPAKIQPVNSQILPSLYLSNLSKRLYDQNQSLSDTDLRYQVTAENLAELLGCRLLDLRIMIENNILQSLNNTQNTRYAIFDIRSLVTGLNPLSPSNQPSFIRFKDILGVMPLYAIELGDVLVALLSNKLSAFVDPMADNVRDGLYISRYSLVRLFKQAMSNDPDKEVLRNNVPKFLGITEVDLRALAKAEILMPIPCHKGNGCYSKSDLINLNNQYFIVSRWAKIRAINPIEIRKKMAEKALQPVIGKNIYAKQCKYEMAGILQKLSR